VVFSNSTCHKQTFRAVGSFNEWRTISAAAGSNAGLPDSKGTASFPVRVKKG